MVAAPVADAPVRTSRAAESAARRERRTVLGAGLVLVAAATAFRAWVIHPAWFFYDDLYFIQRARAHGLTWGYLAQDYNGHLMPASWLLTWVNTELGPFDFTYPAVELVALSGLFGLGVLRLLTTLFGVRRGVLFPLVLAVFSPILLPATTWWAAGVNQLPMLVALTFGLAAFVRHLRDRRTSDLVSSVVWLLAGLAFVERALVIVGFMWLVALLYFAAGTVPARVVRLWRTYRWAVVAHGLLVLGYLALYVPFGKNFSAQSVASRPFFGVLGYLGGVAYPSGTAGGPLRWRLAEVTQSEAHPSQPVLIVSWLVLAAVVFASVRTRHRGARAWLLPLTSLLGNALLIAVSRAIFFGPEISLDFRFQTEVAVLTAVAVGLAFLPVVGAVESSAPRESGWRLDTPGTVLPAAAVFLVAAVASAASFPMRTFPAAISPQSYVETFEASARAEPGRQVLDTTVPAYVWSPIAYPTNQTSRLLGPLAHLVDFRSATTDAAWRVADSGALVPLRFSEARAQQAPVADDGCFATLAGEETSYDLDGPVLGLEWYVQLAYQVDEPVDLTITVGDAERTEELEPGRHYLVTPGGGSYDAVRLSTPDGSAPVCLRHLGVVALAGG